MLPICGKGCLLHILRASITSIAKANEGSSTDIAADSQMPSVHGVPEHHVLTELGNSSTFPKIVSALNSNLYAKSNSTDKRNNANDVNDHFFVKFYQGFAHFLWKVRYL